MSDQKQDELAKCYARVFLGDEDGKRVLEDLLAKFPPDGMRFDFASPDSLKAAIKDGQRSVTTELQTAVRLGAKLAGIQYP
ncbi:hypothetical protein SAMN02745166_01494 [Prosthecobacter debontii]|uniref:Bbp19-like phage domain-containing protein n=1 Tax=Prosthecobacter debontii TaxID=48467 RepID=A0A1T4XH37_9BACT|nr:hypothetical protein [Prosthecobacter debontii]SKA88844.1 hypothetical protein SAMN02745166_01494 [Prosthecobacter debontii]